MSLIEQAARRLEELRRAGIEVPWSAGDAGGSTVTTVPASPDGIAAARVAPARTAESRLRPRTATPRRDSAVARSRQVEIDMGRLLAAGYLTPEKPRMGLTEELRAVKRPIIDHANERANAGQPGGNLVLVTSAVPGEGKTFCAINLAMSIAMEVDHSVLLVDADVVHPSVMNRLGVEGERGMLDVLTDPSLDLSEVLIRTNIPKLSLLPAGSAVATSTELLASGAMEQLLFDLADRYPDRIIIFDGPPLLATSESRVLAARMGQVLLVVQAHQTSQTAITQAVADLEGCETVWCVLNKAATSSRGGSGYERYLEPRAG